MQGLLPNLGAGRSQFATDCSGGGETSSMSSEARHYHYVEFRGMTRTSDYRHSDLRIVVEATPRGTQRSNQPDALFLRLERIEALHLYRALHEVFRTRNGGAA